MIWMNRMIRMNRMIGMIRMNGWGVSAESAESADEIEGSSL